MVVRPRGRPESGRMEHEKDNLPDFGDYSQRLSYRLRDLRRERGLSQEDVANGAGIAIYTYQKYEKGDPISFPLQLLIIPLKKVPHE